MKRTTAVIAALGALGLVGGYAIGQAENRAERNLAVARRTDFVRECHRGVLDRRDAQAIDRDLERFARIATRARRQSGELEVADDYERIAARARNRMRHRKGRFIDCSSLYRVAGP